MFSKDSKFAIIGASNNPNKYGYKVLKNLILKNYNVIPINPHEKEIFGRKVYASLKDIPDKVDVVIFVVPPEVTEKILPEIQRLGIKKVWMQPGTSSKEAIEFCKENGIECVHDSCVMM